MSLKEYFSLFLSVLKDFRVIITVVVLLLVIEFAKFITTYTKKAAKPKTKKRKAAPTPAEEPKVEETPPDMSENDAD